MNAADLFSSFCRQRGGTIYTLVRLSLIEPALLADHVKAYADLLTVEFEEAFTLWQRRLWLNALLLTCLSATVVLAGMSMMLWAVMPIESMRAPWALLLVPVLPAMAAPWCFFQLPVRRSEHVFAAFLQQLRAVGAMFHKVGAA